MSPLPDSALTAGYPKLLFYNIGVSESTEYAHEAAQRQAYACEQRWYRVTDALCRAICKGLSFM